MASFTAAAGEHAGPAAGRFRQIAGFVEDAVLLLLVALLIPVTVLVIGTPIALFVVALLEVARRF